MSASDIAERLKARHAYEAKHYPPPDDLWLQAAAEIISLRADIAALEDGNMTFLCDQLDKAKAENAAQAVELARMRDLVGDLERRAQACLDLNKKAELIGNTGHASRLLAKAFAYAHAADLARQALKAG